MSRVRRSRTVVGRRRRTAQAQSSFALPLHGRSATTRPSPWRRQFDDVTRICASPLGLACRQYPGFRRLLALCRWFACPDPSCPRARTPGSARRGRSLPRCGGRRLAVAGSKTIALLYEIQSPQRKLRDCLEVSTNLLDSCELGAAGDGLVQPMNRKLLRGLVVDARVRGDSIP